MQSCIVIIDSTDDFTVSIFLERIVEQEVVDGCQHGELIVHPAVALASHLNWPQVAVESLPAPKE